MSADVVELNCVTRLDIPSEKVLTSALAKDLDASVVLGWDKSGEFYFASSYAAGPEVLWLLELAKAQLIRTGLGE